VTRPLRARIDCGALRHNLGRVRALAPGSRVLAVVKADAYGHGGERAVAALAGADGFGVATLEEALAVRAAAPAARVVLLEGFFDPGELPPVVAAGLDVVVHCPEQVAALEAFLPRRVGAAWLKLDSGMNRLGFPVEEAPRWHRRLAPLVADPAELRLMTHLACADEPGNPHTTAQLERFRGACAGLPGERSIANSAGLVAWAASRGDWVRPGLMLYGASPLPGQSAADLGLAPVMSLESRLIAVRRCRAGETVGYGATFRCPEDMPVGIVAAGYGDGYPRHAPGGTPVLVDGVRVPLAGRVSMDMIAVDLRPCPGAAPGAPVLLWGDGLPVEEVAARAGTIAYELLCGITGRVPRVFQGADTGSAEAPRRVGAG
jgi:alanine racemase